MPGVVAAPRSARPQRLSSLNNGRNGFKPLPRPTKRAECCDDPKFETIDGAKICINCGTQIAEQNIVSEVTFGESASGAATVDGAFVSEGQRHARTLGAAASRRIGASFQAREDTENNGRDHIRMFTGKLPIATDVSDQALRIWKLAANDNFIQGRRAEEVAGACLYAACRSSPENTVLLMDIAEIITVNVFALGDTYKELCKRLFMEVKGRTNVVEIEPLILKYAAKLEFGEKTRHVAEDAVKIIRRMKRDWIVTGRHPAGLCGACIILAARMNNFRRTVREVVFVVKVADLTISKRLEEFKRTRSGALSVDQFRSLGDRLKVQHDPPSFYAAEEREKKMLEKMRRRQQRNEGLVNIADDVSNPPARQSSAAPSPDQSQPPVESIQPNPAAKRRKASKSKNSTAVPTTPTTQPELRRDADGFAIPALPIDPALLAAANVAASQESNISNSQSPTLENESDPNKRGKPRRDKTKAAHSVPALISEEDLLGEHELQDEIEDILRDDECIGAKDETEAEKLEERTKRIADEQRDLIAKANAARLEQEGKLTSAISMSETIGEDEFEDDPEVANCLLSEDQVKIKEMIWVAHNEDWLRAQQTKQLKRALEEAEGKGDKRATKRRKRSRMGDGTVLEGGTPVESPADANRRMIEKRAPKGFSQRVNYAALGKIYGDRRGTPSDSQAGSEAGTPAPDSRQASPEEVQDEDAEASTAAAKLPTPPATQQQQQRKPGEQGEKDADEEGGGGEEGDGDDDDEGDYWNDADEPDFEAATEDVTGDFGLGYGGEDDEGGYEEYE
ncbi:hypothetical protein MBLNU459_g7609t1 [Dothideomycetes sp. NU459]